MRAFDSIPEFLPIPGFPSARAVVVHGRVTELQIAAGAGRPARVFARDTLGSVAEACARISTLPDLRPLIEAFDRIAIEVDADPRALNRMLAPTIGKEIGK